MIEHLGPERRLATYGSLAPGRSNHHELDGLSGRWSTGTVRGRLVSEGWGAGLGHPAIVLDPSGTDRTAIDVDVVVFESSDLAAHWSRLDAFEGSGYERVVVTVRTGAGAVEASIYALAPPP